MRDPADCTADSRVRHTRPRRPPISTCSRAAHQRSGRRRDRPRRSGRRRCHREGEGDGEPAPAPSAGASAAKTAVRSTPRCPRGSARAGTPRAASGVKPVLIAIPTPAGGTSANMLLREGHQRAAASSCRRRAARPRPRSCFGTNGSVWSCSDVTDWKSDDREADDERGDQRSGRRAWRPRASCCGTIPMTAESVIAAYSVARDEGGDHEAPAVDHDEQEQLEGEAHHDRRHHHHADRHQARGDHDVDHEERHEDDEAR